NQNLCASLKEMGLTVREFEDGFKAPVEKLSHKQLVEREEMWRALWGWLDPTVKRFLFRIGSQVRFMRRDYKGTIGELGEVKFIPSQIEIATYEKVYNPSDGKYYYERKVVIYPYASLAWIEEIIESTLAEDVEEFAVESIPEEELVG
ncbi:MAG: hypothetical protein KKD77_22715, partial [Gammaproteobacteria bacterium]|nr:hypothetical protein [Gammaproteobacteria bacterium]